MNLCKWVLSLAFELMHRISIFLPLCIICLNFMWVFLKMFDSHLGSLNFVSFINLSEVGF